MSNIKLKYLVHLTAPVTATFKADNHRGEPRWERNVIDALLTEGKDVHTTNSIWNSCLEKPINLHDGLNKEWINESILISYGVDKAIHTGYYPEEAKTKYRIIQYLDGPSETTKESFLKYDRENPGSIIATCSFKAWEYMTRLEKVLGKHRVEWVIGPTVPYVDMDANNFNKTNIFWSYRNFSTYAERDPNGMKTLFDKVFSYMKEDQNVTLSIMGHPHNDQHRQALNTNKLGWFFSFPFTKQFSIYQDRINIVYDIHWYEMINIMKDTCLIISPAEPLGGPPFEAAMYGIPTILDKGTNPFQNKDESPFFPGLLTAQKGINATFLDLVDQLYYDESKFINHGNHYRTFVRDNATYKAYVNKIEQIIKQRGWT